MSLRLLQITTAILCIFLCSQRTEAQFIHYTHMNMNPLMLNPANTGGFYGTFRLNALLRDQDWRVAGPNEEYQMVNGSVDININGIALKKEDWISVGVNFGRQGITSNFVRQEMYPSIAYHLVLDKKSMSDLAIGFSVGNVSNTLDGSGDYITRNGLITGNTGDVTQTFSTAQEGKINNSSVDYSLGFVLTTPAGRSADFKMGIAMRQPFNPRINLTGAVSELRKDFTGFLFYYTNLSDRFVWKPGFVVNIEGKDARYLNAQTNFSYQFNEKKDVWLNFGVGARLLTTIKSLQALLGADFGDTRVGLAFDLHFGVPQASGPGAIELGFSKIFKIYKKPEPEPIMLCPRL